MTQIHLLFSNQSDVNKWQTAQILAALQTFALAIEPSIIVGAIHYDNNPGNDQIGLMLVTPELTGSVILKYFKQLTAKSA